MAFNNTERKVEFPVTKFIYRTNLSGDPARDERFHSNARKCNVVIPDVQLADILRMEGFNVKVTNPKDPVKYPPEYYISVNLGYKTSVKPIVKLVDNGNTPVRLDEDTVGLIDEANDNRAVDAVRLICNKYTNPNTQAKSLYIDTMYVEKSTRYDPYADMYNRGDAFDTFDSEEVPF